MWRNVERVFKFISVYIPVLSGNLNYFILIVIIIVIIKTFLFIDEQFFGKDIIVQAVNICGGTI